MLFVLSLSVHKRICGEHGNSEKKLLYGCFVKEGFVSFLALYLEVEFFKTKF